MHKRPNVCSWLWSEPNSKRLPEDWSKCGEVRIFVHGRHGCGVGYLLYNRHKEHAIS